MALTPQINQSILDDIFLCLMTVTSADGNDTARLVNNNEDVVSRGNTYLAYAFSIVLPIDDPDQAPSVRLTIDNVDRRITEFIRALIDPPTFKIEVVLSSAPNTVERTIDFLSLTEVTYDALQVSGTLVPLDPLSLPAIDSVYTGTEFPDLVYNA